MAAAAASSSSPLSPNSPLSPFGAAASTAATIKGNEIPSKLLIDRAAFDDTCTRRFIFGQAFDAYGGTAGLFDFGPVLCSMKANFLQLWRTHFIVEEHMCEVDTTCVTPAEVLRASGHEERFNDFMVRDTVTGECIRLDKYLAEWLETKASDPKTPADDKTKFRHTANLIESMDMEEQKKIVADFGVKSRSGNPLSDPFPFNLMFPTVIGPEGDKKAYLRPELAQGIILNFKRLLDSGNAQRMPFAAAAIGQAFRNEIAPRNSLLRVREFTLAEIEHFINPNNKSHPKFNRVKDVIIWAWNRDQQEKNQPPTHATIGELVEQKLIDNETLGYFIGRTQLFLEKVGAKLVRFRQHMRKEMAHYAQDCWDADLLTSFGWFECVGLADRSAFDLTAHMKGSGKDLRTREQFTEPRVEKVVVREIVKKVAAKTIAKDIGPLEKHLNFLCDADALALAQKLAAGPVPITITAADGTQKTVNASKDFVTIEERDVKRTGYDYVPSVVEPSFGVGRILYAILEQNYYVRKDESADGAANKKNEKRASFALPANLAAQKVAILPLMAKAPLEDASEKIVTEFLSKGIPCRTDDTGVAIGKKYARVDEIGIPYAVTVDFGAIEDGTVTLRERDTTQQVRIPLTDLVDVVGQLTKIDNPLPWKEVAAKYPAQ